MKKYDGANRHTSGLNSCQDLLITGKQSEVDKKAVRERYNNKVLSSIHHGIENSTEESFVFVKQKTNQ